MKRKRVYDYAIEAKAQSSRFATIEEIKEKLKQELLAIPKGRFRSVSRIGKNADINILYLRGLILKGQDSCS